MKTRNRIVVSFVMFAMLISFITIGTSGTTEKYVGIALIEKSTGKLIDYVNSDFDDQGNPINVQPGTLTTNAINSGLKSLKIKEMYVTKSERDALIGIAEKDFKIHYDAIYQSEVNVGNIGARPLPLVTELNASYPVGGIVIYTDNLLYYKAPDGWHHADGKKVN